MNSTTYFFLVEKEMEKNLWLSFFCGWEVNFFLGAISLGVLVIQTQKIVTNLLRTYEKLRCKGESYRFSGQRDPLVHTDRQTDIDPVTLL